MKEAIIALLMRLAEDSCGFFWTVIAIVCMFCGTIITCVYLASNTVDRYIYAEYGYGLKDDKPKPRKDSQTFIKQDDIMMLATQGRTTEDILQIIMICNENQEFAKEIMTLAIQGRPTEDIRCVLSIRKGRKP